MEKLAGLAGSRGIDEVVEGLEGLISALDEEDKKGDGFWHGDSGDKLIAQQDVSLLNSRFRILEPSLKRLKEVVGELSKDKGNMNLYRVAMTEVASLSDAIQDSAKKLERQGKSLETLRRYERSTRKTLQELLKHLKEGEEGSLLVGSFLWKMNKGDCWVLGPEYSFTFDGIWRKAIMREAYMLDEPSSRYKIWKDRVKTAFRRKITGETMLLDLYVSEKDGAELGISSCVVGGNLCMVNLDKELIARKSVYFGNQKDVMFQIDSPLKGIYLKMDVKDFFKKMKLAIYGPGWVFQRFVPRENGTRRGLVFQVNGDVHCKRLGEGESLRTDPRHVYAWDGGVSYGLVKFGSIGERLLRGSIPYHTEFIGPGRVWFSDMDYRAGYLGHLFTPSHWVFKVQEIIGKMLGYLNPANWVD